MSPESSAVLVCNIVFPLLALVAVALRFWARSDKLNSFGQLAADDYFILIALAVALAEAGSAIFGATKGGIGVEQSKLSYDQNVIFLKLVFSGDIVILLGLASVKLSIIFFYRRIFSTSRFRLISSIMIGIVVAWLITFFFCFLFPSWPISVNWTPSLGGKQNINFAAALLMSIVTNIIIDITILCLPLPQLHRLQMSRNRKYLIAGIFWLGGFCVITSIMRLYYATQFTKIYRTPDEAYARLTADLIMWSSIEPNTSIIAACLPTLGPLFRRKGISSSAITRVFATHQSSDDVPIFKMGSWQQVESGEGKSRGSSANGHSNNV